MVSYFKDLFLQALELDENIKDKALALFQRVILGQDNRDLSTIPEEEEICFAMFDMEADKAPGPD
ncbi:hypothetical protein KI387_038322, partial [Taxus chinensis]